jgi:transposase InsO family protein
VSSSGAVKLDAVAGARQQATVDFDKSSDYEKLCWAIAELEKRERKSCDIRKDVDGNLKSRIVRLIGDKPLFSCKLDGVEAKVLWDSGSQVSVVDSEWVSTFAPNAVVRPVSDFLEPDEQVEFMAANNTEVPMVGAVILEFKLGDSSFPVPFVITSGQLSQPIIGFNVMKHMICSGERDTVISSLRDAMGDVAVGKITVMVNLISRNFEDTDCVGTLKSTRNILIPAKGVARIKCRVKGDVRGMDLSFVCSKPLVGDWDSDLEVTESLGEIVRGRTPHVNIEIRNNSSKPKEIKENMVVGEISSVTAVIPIKLDKGYVDKVNVNSLEIGVEEDSKGTESPIRADAPEFVPGSQENHETLNLVEGQKWLPKANLDHLTPEQRAEIEQLLWEECDLFARNDTDIGEIPELQMDIKLTDEIPVNEAYRHLPRKLYDDVKTYLNDLIINGWIAESTSAYASPIVCVRKKDNTMRMCVDYRKLNLKMIPDRHPIPRVQDILDGLGGQKFFSTLDMAKAYHQGFIKESCRKYTAFATPWALYEWLRIPFGLKNAPAAFQRYISQALMGLLDRVCMAYLDDVLVYGKTFKEPVTNLKQVFKRLKSKGVKLRVDKCHFAKQEVRYLGRLVSEEGYRPDPEDIKALEKFRVAPNNVGEVRSMLGFLGYYRGHVKDFAKRMKPVYDLIKADKSSESPGPAKAKSGKTVYDKRRMVTWTAELQTIIDQIIDTLQSPEVMAYPDFDQPFILNCDASGYGLGAVLYQRQNDKLRVISYASRTLTDAEKNYHLHSGKCEFLALKWSVTEKFSDYLGYGAHFTVFTDNNPLTYVMTSAKLNATGMRWVGELADYDFTLKYRPGKDSADADGLSRNPLTIEELERECTETVGRQDLSVIFSPPDVSNILPIDVKVLECPVFPSDLKAISSSELGKAQSDDHIVGPIYRAVALNIRPKKKEWIALSRKSRLLCQQWEKLQIDNGVLMRKTPRYSQVVLPQIYHSLVFSELHQKMGHLASDRVECLARQRFYWPHMATDIEYFIKKKCSCVFTKKPNVQERAKLVPIGASYPFEVVSVDFLHLDKCKGGFEYVLVVCDHFTRFSQAYATKSKSSRAAAEKLFNHFILQFGFPKRIHHDRGGEFNSQLFKHLHRLANIKESNTTPYHPMGDPIVERYNRTLLNMLKSIPENAKNNWKDHLATLTFAYNSTVHKSTGFSPFYLMFGRESRLPIDGIFPNAGKDGDSEESYGSFVDNWKSRMDEAFQLAARSSKKVDDGNKKRYDARARSVEIEIGDRVVVQNRNKGGTGKLNSYWNPDVYVVVGKRDDIPVYDLREYRDVSTRMASGTKPSKIRRLHRNLLKKVNEMREPENDQQPSLATPPIASKKKVKFVKEPEEVPIPTEESSDDEGVLVVREGIAVPYPDGDPPGDEGDEVHVDEEATVVNEHEEVSSEEELSADEEYVTEDSDEENSPPRRSSRPRAERRVFMYDKLGGNPSLQPLQ